MVRTMKKRKCMADVGPYPLAVVFVYSSGRTTLISKGHHDPAAFMEAVEKWNGGPLEGRWGNVRHGWHRTVPDSTGEYRYLVHPAKPHARGAYPTTRVVDDAD